MLPPGRESISLDAEIYERASCLDPFPAALRLAHQLRAITVSPAQTYVPQLAIGGL
jgi:hypothetical protein